jgi:hypothetical protein
MFYSTSGPDSFNKTTNAGQGTLIQNWQEERVLRDETGEGRTHSRNHMKKIHDDLFRKPPQELGSVYTQNEGQDETFGRVFGRKHDPTYISEHKDKFAHRTFYKEPAYGKKHELIQRQYLQEIRTELNSAQKSDEDLQNQRYLNSTYANEFAQKNVGVNVIGRKVMRDQNGKSLTPNTRDQDLLVDNGLLNRAPLSKEADLQAAVKKESYVRAQPYTFWAEKAKEGVFYNSKETGDHAPFSRNNDFLKTYSNYTHQK